jgi:YD repeat-containing protein
VSAAERINSWHQCTCNFGRFAIATGFDTCVIIRPDSNLESIMPSNDPSRRSLLGVLLGALFGGFFVKKAAAVEPARPSLPAATACPSARVVKDPPGFSFTTVYNADGRPLRSIDALGNVTTYPSAGRQP